MLHKNIGRTQIKNQRSIARLTALVIFIASLSVTTIQSFASNFGQDLDKLNRFVQGSTNVDSSSSKLFLEGRTLIASKKWTEAAKKFNQIIKDYPDSDNVDVALYWLAYANKEQEQYKEASRSLDRIINEYPNSTWVHDARAMKEIIAAYLGRGSEFGVIEDDNDEIKIIAMRGLFQADPARAVAKASALLKRNSGASPQLKQYTVELLGHYGGKDATPILVDIARNEQDAKLRRRAIYSLGWRADDNIASMLKEIVTSSDDPEVAKTALWALTTNMEQSKKSYAFFAQIAKSGKTLELRKQAISALFRSGDDKVIDELVGIYRANDDVEIKRAIITTLGSGGFFYVPVIAGSGIGYGEGLGVTYVDGQVIESALAARADSIRAHGGIASTAPVAEAPRPATSSSSGGSGQNAREPVEPAAPIAIARPGQTINWSSNHSAASAAKRERAAVVLVQLYDSEKDESLKSSIISALGSTGQKPATKKLMDIARSESSMTLKKRAVSALSRSKDPEVLSFLEELIK
jgi:HEAT repeat protein